jgi:tetratricopeptide (TPR) repeat protein
MTIFRVFLYATLAAGLSLSSREAVAQSPAATSSTATAMDSDMDSDEDSDDKDTPRKNVKTRSTREIADAVLKKALGTPSPRDRVRLSERIHAQLNKTRFAPAEEGILFAALGLLHAQEKSTRLAAPAFLTRARKQWPALVETKEAVALWKIAREAYDGATVADESALTQVAGALSPAAPPPALAPGEAPLPATPSLAGSPLATAEDTSFHYYEGLHLFQIRRLPEAYAALSKVAVDVPEYRRSKYLESLIHSEAEKWDEARQALQIVVAMDPSTAEKDSPLSTRAVTRLRELGVLNLARLAYERGEFLESLAYYRSLMHDSPFFHESLSEQGWAFFMAGFPNRALGAQYAAVSPFFADKFNPDAYFLNAVLFYWMCDFDGARSGLARFVSHTKQEGDELRRRVAALSSLPEGDALLRYAKIYEDAKAGVSAKNLGLGVRTLGTLLAKEAPRDIHASLAAMIQDRIALTRSISKRAGADRILKSVGAFERELRLGLGRRTQMALGALDADFEKGLSQARLLYLEILTAKKDALLGRDRSVKGQEFTGIEKPFEEAFGNADTQKWAQDKNEFWYDELGHYVFQQESKCGQPAASGGE